MVPSSYSTCAKSLEPRLFQDLVAVWNRLAAPLPALPPFDVVDALSMNFCVAVAADSVFEPSAAFNDCGTEFPLPIDFHLFDDGDAGRQRRRNSRLQHRRDCPFEKFFAQIGADGHQTCGFVDTKMDTKRLCC